MKKLYSSPDALLINHFKNILDNHNIPCTIKNAYLTSGIGELPPNECWLELWVFVENNYLTAKNLIEEALAPSVKTDGSWRCQTCGEQLENQFNICWKCGSNRPG